MTSTSVRPRSLWKSVSRGRSSPDRHRRPHGSFHRGPVSGARTRGVASHQDARALALIVGGTGHYVQALSERFSVPRVEPDWALRRLTRIRGRSRWSRSAACASGAHDPVAAERIPATNVRRVIRALEVVSTLARCFLSRVDQNLRPRRPCVWHSPWTGSDCMRSSIAAWTP